MYLDLSTLGQPTAAVLLFTILVATTGVAHPVAAQDADAATDRILVRGEVVDTASRPLAGVNVFVAETGSGAVTDSTGAFQFQIRPDPEPYTLIASFVGYRRETVSFTARTSASVDPIRIVLRPETVEIDEIVVSTSRYTTGLDENATLTPFDVVTTAGTSADIFQAIQTVPGVTSADKGAELFVRGGLPSETITLLDNATVAHPTKFESPTTSTFGTLPPFLVESTAFSAGGFSARYGNALSGILDMETGGYPGDRSVTANLGLAAASVGVDVPVTDDIGLRFSGNRSFTEVLFRVNGAQQDFAETPRSTESNLSLIADYSETGSLRFFHFLSTDRLGVRVTGPTQSGLYRSQAARGLHNLFWRDRLGQWALEGSLSMNWQQTDRRFGALDLEPRSRQWKVRGDGRRPLGDRTVLRAGAETVRLVDAVAGTVPAAAADASGDAEAISYEAAGMRTGAYAEMKSRLGSGVSGRVGVRMDHHTLAQDWVVDPRVSVRYDYSSATTLRLAWGIYHQFPEPEAFSMAGGEGTLGAERAQHVVAGVEHTAGPLRLQIEGYWKPYEDLVIERGPTELTNDGEGWAVGADVFIRYGAFLETPIYGRLAYSLLDAERLQPRRRGREVVLERGPAPSDITQNVTLVLNGTVPRSVLGGYLSGGFTLRHATGAPITPVRDAISAGGGTAVLPVEGSVGSDRLPAYRRVDAQVNFYLPIDESGSNVVVYAAVNNLLGRTNVIDVTYTRNYEDRRLQPTTFDRSVYGGVTVTLSL